MTYDNTDPWRTIGMGQFSGPDPNAEYMAQVNAIREAFAKQRDLLQKRIYGDGKVEGIQQQIARAQAECSAGQQSSCQMIGGLNSQMQTLLADLDRLSTEENRAIQELEQQQKSQKQNTSFSGSGNPWGGFGNANAADSYYPAGG